MSKQSGPAMPEAVASAADRERVPNPSGDLDTILAPRPQFRLRMRGYDVLEVDNYLTWLEDRLRATGQLAQQALASYGACAAEARELSRRVMEQRRDRSLSDFSERIRSMLQLAAEEAVEVRLAAAREAEDVVNRAHAEAAAVLK